MKKTRGLEERIESMRRALNHLINEKGELTDPVVTAASQRLDRLLDEYYRINK